jgi:hypothetical protein
VTVPSVTVCEAVNQIKLEALSDTIPVMDQSDQSVSTPGQPTMLMGFGATIEEVGPVITYL